jgi:dolichol-phosphate mannosyltransferase
MINNLNIAVVIPVYKVERHIKQVIETLPDFIDHVIVVDDNCPKMSLRLIENNKKNTIIKHDKNLGVGGAVVSGYRKALILNADIVIKVDGDGQMDPNKIMQLITPILEEKADYTKGNRFKDYKSLKSMPKIRLFGNSILSFSTKLASGYWDLMDPTNGFTAITKRAIEGLNLNLISKRYFFETDMLIHLNIENCVVKDVPIPANYADEVSSMNIKNIIFTFPPKLLKGLFKRIFLKYYVFDFNMLSIYLFFGLPMLFFGTSYGIYHWIKSSFNHAETPVGTVMLAVLPIILGVQFLLQAIQIDINNIPKKES